MRAVICCKRYRRLASPRINTEELSNVIFANAPPSIKGERGERRRGGWGGVLKTKRWRRGDGGGAALCGGDGCGSGKRE